MTGWSPRWASALPLARSRADALEWDDEDEIDENGAVPESEGEADAEGRGRGARVGG